MEKTCTFSRREGDQFSFWPLQAYSGLTKTAQLEISDKLHPRIQDFVRAFKPTKHGVYVLVNAMGASEYWGSNANGDAFPEKALIHAPSDWDELSPEQMKRVGKTWEYGFPTFMNAHVFTHHQNKDPAHAIGEVVLAVWNPKMHRVELILYIDRSACMREGSLHVIERIERGEYPDVSMGCFTAGHLVTMADGTRKPIEQVAVGDLVLTHLGFAKKVTATHSRPYRGELYTIHAEGHNQIECTHQHPFLQVTNEEVKEKDDHSNWQWKKDAELRPMWAHAECLSTDEYLLEPVFRFDDTVSPWTVQPSRAEARLLGYYLAEGHILRNKKKEICGIELTTHEDDPVHQEIEELCREYGTQNPPAFFDRVNSCRAIGIYIFDKRLGDYCHQMVGQYSKFKKLRADVLSWEPESQLELLGAYANGDGCGPVDGSLKLSTASQDLAQQWLTVLPRLGIIASCNVLEHRAGSGYSYEDTREWVVHIGKQWAQKLHSYTAKVRRVEIIKPKNSRKLMNGGITSYVVTPIRDIEVAYSEVMVYNLEVEDDESYLVEGLAVHNCKVPYDVCLICGNKSKTRADYCPCCTNKPGLNKILGDGRKVAVRNDFPRFFDISVVFIGADKTAKVMAKLAENGNQNCLGSVCFLKSATTRQSPTLVKMAGPSCPCEKLNCSTCCVAGAEKYAERIFGVKSAAQRKLSEIIKDIPAGPFTKKTLPKIEQGERDIPNDILDLMGGLGPEKALSTPAMMGIALKPREFQRLILVCISRKPEADQLDREHRVFQPGGKDNIAVPTEPGFVDDRLQELLSLLGLFRDRSAAGPLLHKRMMRAAHHAERKPEITTDDSPLMKKLAALYNGYRASLLKKATDIERHLICTPQLRAELFDGSMAQAFARGSEKIASASVLGPDSLAYLMGAYYPDRDHHTRSDEVVASLALTGMTAEAVA